MKEKFQRKGVSSTLFLLIILSACTHSCRQWESLSLHAICPPQIYHKIYLPPETAYNGIQVELITCGNEQRLYFCSLALAFPESPIYQGGAEVSFIIDEEKSVFIADRLEGGQRLMLPPQARDLMINALLGDRCICITVGQHIALLTPLNFSKLIDFGT